MSFKRQNQHITYKSKTNRSSKDSQNYSSSKSKRYKQSKNDINSVTTIIGSRKATSTNRNSPLKIASKQIQALQFSNGLKNSRHSLDNQKNNGKCQLFHLVSRFEPKQTDLKQFFGLKTALIKQKQFLNFSQVVKQYSKNVFQKKLSFKRFTNLLRKKYRQSVQPRKQQFSNTSNKKSAKISPFFKEDYKEACERFARNTLTAKLALYRRPSSGIAMKKGDLFVKRRKNSLAQTSKGVSIDVKHIDTLQHANNAILQLARSSTPKKKPFSPILKRQTKSNLFKSLQIKGEKLDRIEPWQDDSDRLRLLTDIDITIRI